MFPYLILFTLVLESCVHIHMTAVLCLIYVPIQLVHTVMLSSATRFKDGKTKEKEFHFHIVTSMPEHYFRVCLCALCGVCMCVRVCVCARTRTFCTLLTVGTLFQGVFVSIVQCVCVLCTL